MNLTPADFPYLGVWVEAFFYGTIFVLQLTKVLAKGLQLPHVRALFRYIRHVFTMPWIK